MRASNLEPYFFKSIHFDCFMHDFSVPQVKPLKFLGAKILGKEIKMSYYQTDAIDMRARTLEPYFFKYIHFNCFMHDFSLPKVKPIKFLGVKIFGEKPDRKSVV